jgi:hypothetical protein
MVILWAKNKLYLNCFKAIKSKMDCNHYFLSTTAIEIWQNDDTHGHNRMYNCLVKMHKENFFKSVIFKSTMVPEHISFEIAENVFSTSWVDFNIKGKAGQIIFEKAVYTGLFYTIFKRNYLKQIKIEMRNIQAEKEYRNSKETSEMPIDKIDIFSPRTLAALNKISPNCKQMLIWKHIDGLSHDEIALKKIIDRESSIKMVSRCGKDFLKKWLSAELNLIK